MNMYMNIQKYFIDFDYKNESTKKKCLPFVHQFHHYEYLIRFKYTIRDLRNMLKILHLPKCKYTRKDDIKHFCTNMLYLSYKINKIQKAWRNHFIRMFNKTLGPSYRNYQISNNMEDFLTTDSIKDIDYYYYFSFKDNDNFVYTFHIVSIFSLLQKNITKNPYNRIEFDTSLIELVKKRMNMNKILNKMEEFTIYQPKPTTITDRVNQLFHHMDQLGNYTHSAWFMQLNSRSIRIFIYELYEIWNYRAQLSIEAKETICPPRGNPFIHLPRNFISNFNNPYTHYSYTFLRTNALNIMEKLSYNAHDNENKNMGVLYILSALTLVSEPARDAMPWLYASVYHN